MTTVQLSLKSFVQPTIWALVSAVLFFAIAQHALRQGMPKPISPRYTLYAIPAAISLLRGYPHDYTAQNAIAAEFSSHPERDTNSQIKQQLVVPIAADAGQWFVSGDDKGLIDLTYAAFVIFGATTGSVVQVIVSLIALSALAFFLEFKSSDAKMAALVAFLGALYALIYVLGVTDQAFSLGEPRFFGAMSTIASLHLMFLVTSERPMNWITVILAAAQLCLIVFVVHLRSSEIWQVLAIVGFAGFIVAFRRSRWRRAAIVAGLCVAGIAGLTAYKHATYNSHYFKDEISTRVFWHNALMGLAINPALREKYGFEILRDDRITEAVRHDMIKRGKADEAAVLFPRPDYWGGNFAQFNWSSYEKQARDMYLHILRDDTKEVLKTYLGIAPQIAWENLEFLSNRRTEAASELSGMTTIASSETRKSQDLYYSLDRLLPILAVIMSIIAMAPLRSRLSSTPAVALLFLLGLSLISPTLATPDIQYILTPLLMASALFYFMVAASGALFIRFVVSAINLHLISPSL